MYYHKNENISSRQKAPLIFNGGFVNAVAIQSGKLTRGGRENIPVSIVDQ